MGSLSIFDWLVICLMLASVIVVGYSASEKNASPEDYLVGGKCQKPKIVGLSLFATLFSALSYLLCPGETIKNGPLYLAGMLSYPLSAWIVGKYMIPRFCRYSVASGYEILEIELGKNSRNVASVFFILLRFLWMSAIMYAMVTKALLPLSGIDGKWGFLICFILIVITVFYTSAGGFSAVLKTDAFQSIVMFMGVILTIIVILCSLPSLDILTDAEFYSHWPRVEWKPDFSCRMTIMNLFIMDLCWQVSTAGSDQMAIQRYLSVKDANAAAQSYSVSLVSATVVKLLLSVVGILVMIYFMCMPQELPIGFGLMENADSLFPLFILKGLPNGITGLIIAALIAAAMSSLSSGILSVSTVIQEDVLKRRQNPSISIKNIRLISVLLGILVSLSFFVFDKISGNLYDLTMKVVNLVVEPLFVLFFTALFLKKGTDLGAVSGGIASLLAAILVSFVGIWDISELWIMPISFVVGVSVSIFVSLLDREHRKIAKKL